MTTIVAEKVPCTSVVDFKANPPFGAHLEGNSKQQELSSNKHSSASITNSSNSRTNTISMAKFKEKRPEPLKLNPNLNQEIPLDLSVKR